jgi:hypothetical protein
VNARDRVKLLFGPYQAPPLRRGDRATCLLRDCDVVITSWSTARIPWPRFRPAHDYRCGGSGLLLDEELARAVRHEWAAALMYWWGASPGAVQRWRRVLGVGRTDNEGTARLMRAAAEKGGEAGRERGLTNEECDERSRRALRLNLGRHLRTGYHGPRWTQAQLRLLGKHPDEVVAAKIGRTAGAVRCKRTSMGIPSALDRRKCRGRRGRRGAPGDGGVT